MVALTQDRNSPSKHLQFRYVHPVAAGAKVFAGGMAAVNAAGFLIPAANAAGVKAVIGRLATGADNSAGANGAKAVEVDRGLFRYKNGTAAVTQAHVGGACWVEDDQTVQSSPGAFAVVAGEVVAVDALGVWVAQLGALAQGDGAALSGASETIAAAGALSQGTTLTRLEVDGTMAFTLASGQHVGQVKHVRCVAAANTPSGVLTPANLLDGTTITFDAVGEEAALIWVGDEWHLLHLQGATLA